MHALDWAIVAGLHRVAGLRRRQADSARADDPVLFSGKPQPALVGGRAVGHGHPAERDHARRDDRTGLYGRPAVRPVLFRPPARDDHPVADGRSVLLPGGRLHCVRVPGTALRPEDADAHQPAVSAVARHGLRRRGRRAGGCALGRSRVERDAHGAADCGARRRLHDLRRRAGGDVDRRQGDGPDGLRPRRGVRRARCSGSRARSASATRCAWLARPAGSMPSTSGSRSTKPTRSGRD